MSSVTKMPDANAVERVLIDGDLSRLDSSQRIVYYNQVCDSVGLNPLTKPFEYIELNRKLVLYAKRDATDQLRKIHGISIQITAREKTEDLYVVTARAKNAAGREDESVGAVNIANLRGDSLANAIMKAETKAKRRVTLSICGMGLLDEAEVEDIPGAKQPKDVTPPNQAPPPKGSLNPPESPIEHEGLAGYPIPFGRLAGQMLGDLSDKDLIAFEKELEDGARQKGRMSEPVAECLRQIRNYREELDRGAITF
jgi:hypothetical protein